MHAEYSGVLLDAERYEDSMAAADRAVELNPGNVVALANHGTCQGRLGRPREGLEELVHALEIGGEARFAYTSEHVIDLLFRHRDADLGEPLEDLKKIVHREAARDPPHATAVWNLYLMVALWHERRSVDEVLAAVEDVSRGGSRRAADIRDALEALNEGLALRINCGGGEWRDANGLVWRHDRFSVSGEPIQVDPAPPGQTVPAPDAPAIYRSARRFPGEGAGPAGYRVPVPPGDYRVTLHFVDASPPGTGARVFGIKVEDEVVHERYRPRRTDASAANRTSFVVKGVDALLGLLFLPVRGSPHVCAIEIERLAGG
jgi:hypothetical protein